MGQYTDQATRIKQVTEGDGHVEIQDVTEIITRLVAEYSRRSNDCSISADLPRSAKVEANLMFEAALEELVANAVKHNDTGTSNVTIDVRDEDGPSHMVSIEVSDDGPGIPENELDPLQQGTEDQVLHLSGMGLWFVKWTVRHSNGELEFEDRAPRGTTVIVRVPKAAEGLSSKLSPLNAN